MSRFEAILQGNRDRLRPAREELRPAA